jgi:hypothetical protein
MAGTIIGEKKKESQRKVKRWTVHKEKKEKKASPFRGRKLSHHNLSNVTCIQIVKSNTVVCTFITC